MRGKWLRELLYGVYERRLTAASRYTSRSRGTSASSSTATVGGPSSTGRTPAPGTGPEPPTCVEFLGWCEEVGVEVVTLWLLSTDNLSRPSEELTALYTIIEDLVGRIAATGRWRVHPVGSLDLLPTSLVCRPQGERGRHP